MGEVTNLASGGVGLLHPEMSTYFWALLIIPWKWDKIDAKINELLGQA